VHGLVNKSIQCFIGETYGQDTWELICQDADLGFSNFEAMLIYDVRETEAVLNAACTLLDRARSGLLEDLGTYLVTNPRLDAVRRLLRFGGDTFVEFLHTLDDMHDRAKFALPELDFPTLELQEHSTANFSLMYRWGKHGFGSLVLGVLRAMADDYGALVLLEYEPGRDAFGDMDRIGISLLDAQFAQGREFSLGASGAGTAA